ncbi:MAG: ABC transporter ATP-binding protein [Bacillota bacterium]
MQDETLLRAENLARKYRRGALETWGLRDASLEVRRGEFVSIVGPSGSGKSTLLHLLACLDRPSSGRLWFRDIDVTGLPDSRLALIRNRFIGVVFQAYNLLPGMNAWRNVALPLVYMGVPRGERKRRAFEALEKVGLGTRVNHYPYELSGGEEQRVAVARAIVTRPVLLLADEPTGNLDTNSQSEFMEVVRALREAGTSIVMVTHNSSLAEQADRTLLMLDGRLGEVPGPGGRLLPGLK